MNFFKALTTCAVLLALSACSSNGNNRYDDESQHTSKASTSQIQELETKVGDRVFFELDSSKITSDGQETLRKQAAFMDQNSGLKFTLEGHTDDRGTREYNIGLAERRANSVKEFLTSVGIPSNHLTVISYGKERPAVEGSNDWSWSQNRRVVTVAQ